LNGHAIKIDEAAKCFATGRNEMEKICIVKRRKRDLFPVPEKIGEKDETEFSAGKPVLTGFGRAGSREASPVISLDLTPRQSGVILSREGLRPGKTFAVRLESLGAEGDQVVFSFRLAPLHGGRMLSPRDVSAMLGISRSFLMKLVRTGKIDSYRIGRLRRFLLEDILHYLGHCREFPDDAP
jgi:excisionase family DNA binding protein